MAIKASAVLEDAVHRIPIAELMSGAPSFEWTIPLPSGDFSPRHEHIQFELDNYQIAFVSFHSGQDRADGNPQRTSRMGRLFLLPLTWREFVMRVDGALSHRNSLEENKILRFGRVSIDFLSMEVRRSDCQVSLTAMGSKSLSSSRRIPTE